MLTPALYRGLPSEDCWDGMQCHKFSVLPSQFLFRMTHVCVKKAVSVVPRISQLLHAFRFAAVCPLPSAFRSYPLLVLAYCLPSFVGGAVLLSLAIAGISLQRALRRNPGELKSSTMHTLIRGIL